MPPGLLHIPIVRRRLAHFVALLLATNYFGFQVELFEDEYEEHHRRHDDRVAFSSPTLTWESFDKDNAPQPFVVTPRFNADIMIRLQPPAPDPFLPHPRFTERRDKSPPY